MELVRINDVVNDFGLSSRTLRYYEEKGLLWSHHPGNKAQRYYDAAALERLKQIIVLRKLQIPVKDIVTIFKNENMSALIQAFVDKLESLDTEISALSELRRLVDDFLHKMLISGIKKISAITLLYEETEKRLDLGTYKSNLTADSDSAALQQESPQPESPPPEPYSGQPDTTEIDEAVTFENLSTISREALRLNDIRIIRLPPMRMLTSRRKTGEAESLDGDKMQNLFADYGFLPIPGMRDCFMIQGPGDEWVMHIKIPDDYKNETIYLDEYWSGGLYAVAATFFESLDDTFILLREWVNSSGDFQLDKQHPEMLEEILPWDIVKLTGKWQQDVFIPINKKET